MTPVHDDSDDALGRRLATELPRHAAPPRLRAAVLEAAAPPRRRAAWLSSLLAATATALVFVLFVIPALPRAVPADPVQRLVRAAVSEHSRALMWGSRHAEIVPAALPWLTQESGIGLARVFVGDDALTFVGAEPVYLERVRGIALHYRDADDHLLSYIALPAPTLGLPDRARLQIGRFRPALLRDSGFAAWVWKHGDVACFLVSDMVSSADLERFKQHFLRIRLQTEPYPAN